MTLKLYYNFSFFQIGLSASAPKVFFNLDGSPPLAQ